jgi:predicted tellurium resistance membrane protein TerC
MIPSESNSSAVVSGMAQMVEEQSIKARNKKYILLNYIVSKMKFDPRGGLITAEVNKKSIYFQASPILESSYITTMTFDFAIFSQPEAWIGLLTLTFLEIVLGIDNVIFISIVAGKLPLEQQPKARRYGILLAMVFRIALLLSITWIVGMTDPIFSMFGKDISTKDLILIIGGLFLIAKSTSEIHGKIEGEEEGHKKTKTSSFFSVLVQIILIDMIFSFDSILTAVGLTREILIMIIAVVISMVIMLVFAGKISDFIHKHPTINILALSFLILIGFMLVIEGLHFHVPKGYIYFALFFSLVVEAINMQIRKRRKA